MIRKKAIEKKRLDKSDIIGSLIIKKWPKNSYGIKSLKKKKNPGPKCEGDLTSGKEATNIINTNMCSKKKKKA
jgi:hypothetical protein